MPKIKIFIKDKEIFLKKLQYMASNNLNWHVNYDLTPNWAKVVPPSGSGNANVSVSAIPASSLSETDLTGEIVIESDNGQEVRISVERCIKCETSTTISYGYIEKNFEACDTSSGKTANVPYSSITINEDCTSSVTTSESSVTFNNLSGRNCSASSRSQIIKVGNKNIAKGTQAGGCRDIECFGPCECTPSYTQKTPYPNVAGTGGTVTVTWNASYATSCDNPRCSAFTVNERVEVPCNSGAARTYSGSSTSYGTWRVSQASGTPGDCGICNYTCADFLGVTAYTIPANPTSDLVNLFYFDVNEKNRYKGDTPGWSFVFAYDGDDGIFNGNVHGHHDYNFTDIGNGVTRCIVSLPKSYIKVNDRTTQKTVSLSLKGYVCSNETYTYYTLPSSMTCSVGTVTITQSAAEQACNITSVSCSPTAASLSNSVTSVTTTVTVQGTGNSCAKTWTASVMDNGGTSTVTGNNGSSLTVKEAQTVTIRSIEDSTKSCTFTVTQGHENTMTASIKIRKVDGKAVPTITITSMSGGWSSNPPSHFYIDGKAKNNIGNLLPFTISLGNRGALSSLKEYCGNFDPVPSYDDLGNGGSLESSTFSCHNVPDDFGYELISGGIIGTDFECTD